MIEFLWVIVSVVTLGLVGVVWKMLNDKINENDKKMIALTNKVDEHRLQVSENYAKNIHVDDKFNTLKDRFDRFETKIEDKLDKIHNLILDNFGKN